MKTGLTLGTATETLAHMASGPARQWPCAEPDCIGYHTTVGVVDGVEVLTTFCERHTELRFRAVWALDPCDRYFALTGADCLCPSGEPSSSMCLAIRAYYLPKALLSCVARSQELERLRALPPTVEGVEGRAGGRSRAHVRPTERHIVHQAREHAPVASGTRRTGLSA